MRAARPARRWRYPAREPRSTAVRRHALRPRQNAADRRPCRGARARAASTDGDVGFLEEGARQTPARPRSGDVRAAPSTPDPPRAVPVRGPCAGAGSRSCTRTHRARPRAGGAAARARSSMRRGMRGRRSRRARTPTRSARRPCCRDRRCARPPTTRSNSPPDSGAAPRSRTSCTRRGVPLRAGAGSATRAASYR